MSRIDEIRERCDKATPGPWAAQFCEWNCDCYPCPGDCDKEPNSCGNGCVIQAATVPEIKTVEWGDFVDMNDADADFVANSREDIPWLLSEHDRLQAEVEGLRRERDAAVADLNDSGACFSCKNFTQSGGKCRGFGKCRLDGIEVIPCNEPGTFRIEIPDDGRDTYDWRGVKEDG